MLSAATLRAALAGPCLALASGYSLRSCAASCTTPSMSLPQMRKRPPVKTVMLKFFLVYDGSNPSLRFRARGRKDSIESLASQEQDQATNADVEAKPEEPVGQGFYSMSDPMSQRRLSDAGSNRSRK